MKYVSLMKFLALSLFSVAILVACGAKETKNGNTRPSTPISDEDLEADLAGAEDGDKDPTDKGDPDISGLDGGDGSGDTAVDGSQGGEGKRHEKTSPDDEDVEDKLLGGGGSEGIFENSKPLDDKSFFKNLPNGKQFTGIMHRLVFSSAKREILTKDNIIELSETNELSDSNLRNYVHVQPSNVHKLKNVTFDNINDSNSEIQMNIIFENIEEAPIMIRFEGNNSTQDNLMFKEKGIFTKKAKETYWYWPPDWIADLTYTDDYINMPLPGKPFPIEPSDNYNQGFMYAEFKNREMKIILRYPPSGSLETIDVFSIPMAEYLPDATDDEKKPASKPQHKIENIPTKKQLPAAQPAGGAPAKKKQTGVAPHKKIEQQKGK